MAFNLKKLLTDLTGYQPVPQYFNQTTDNFEVVQGQNGGANVNVIGSNYTLVALLSAVTATGRGNDIQVGGLKTITFEVFGTASSFTIQMEGKGTSGTPYPIQAINYNSMTSISTITAAGLYQVDVTGLVSIDANLTAVTGGNVTVQGRMMA